MNNTQDSEGQPMSKSIVSIAKGDDVEKLLAEVLEPLGGITALIRPNTTVVVKPNAGHLGAPDTSVNTNPDLVAAVIKELRKAKPKEIILAEASAVGCDTMECFTSSGILKAAEDAGVDKVIDIKSEKELFNIPIRDARSDIKKVRLPRFLIEAEHIVNLPIFKSHCSMVFTCALKNMKGVVQDKVHYQMHQTNLVEAMMDLWSVFRADVNIADLIRPGAGFGPHSTMPMDYGCLVAGQDPVAVDATACRMVGLGIDRVAYFEPARLRGLGQYHEDQIEVRGRTIEEVHKPMWLPYMDDLGKYKEYTIDTEGACSSCLALVGLTMEKLIALGEYEKNKDVTILVGRKKEIPEGIPKDKLVLVGDCLKKFRDKGIQAVGCPPAEPFPLWAIIDRKDYLDIPPDARERMAADEKPFSKYLQKLVAQWEQKSA